MMTGQLTAELYPLIRLKVRRADLQWRETEVLVDTGYSDLLALQIEIIEELALTGVGSDVVEMADGSIVTYDIYVGTILWDDQERIVLIQAISGQYSLLGMAMLHDHIVTLGVTYQGSVTITRRT